MIHCSVQIKIEEETLSFPPATAQKLSLCSELIRTLMEERDDLDPDSTDSISVQIDTHDFTMSHIKKSIEYLEHYDYNPPKYGNIISHDLRKNLSDDWDSEFAASFTMLTIKPIHACAEYLQIFSLRELCLIRIGSEVFIDSEEPGSIFSLMKEHGLTDVYSVQTEIG
jgi:hypothetical protein